MLPRARAHQRSYSLGACGMSMTMGVGNPEHTHDPWRVHDVACEQHLAHKVSMMLACALLGMRGPPKKGRGFVLPSRLNARSMMDALIHGAQLFGHTRALLV